MANLPAGFEDRPVATGRESIFPWPRHTRPLYSRHQGSGLVAEARIGAGVDITIEAGTVFGDMRFNYWDQGAPTDLGGAFDESPFVTNQTDLSEVGTNTGVDVRFNWDQGTATDLGVALGVSSPAASPIADAARASERPGMAGAW